MVPHSSTLAWKIPWTEEPGRLQGVAKSRTRLSDFTFTFHFDVLEKEMATHSSVLALGLALGSPIFPSGCEGKLGVALESLQGRRDLI